MQHIFCWDGSSRWPRGSPGCPRQRPPQGACGPGPHPAAPSFPEAGHLGESQKPLWHSRRSLMMFQGCSTYDGMLSNKRRQDVLELRLEKLAIHAFGLQQFLMATLLDDLTIRQDHNLIGALHHGQLVGDDDNCVP